MAKNKSKFLDTIDFGEGQKERQVEAIPDGAQRLGESNLLIKFNLSDLNDHDF